MEVSIVKFGPRGARLACEMPVGRGLFVDILPGLNDLQISVWVKDGIEDLQSWSPLADMVGSNDRLARVRDDFFTRREESILRAGILQIIDSGLGRPLDTGLIGDVLDAAALVMQAVGGDPVDDSP